MGMFVGGFFVWASEGIKEGEFPRGLVGVILEVISGGRFLESLLGSISKGIVEKNVKIS